MHKQLEPLLQKEMTRREFLAHIGLVVAGFFGLSALWPHLFMHSQSNNTSNTYGSANYGNRKEG